MFLGYKRFYKRFDGHVGSDNLKSWSRAVKWVNPHLDLFGYGGGQQGARE